MNNKPFFSVCVPTRNRPDTLFHCLKTLLNQDFENYEIIVSDNSDGFDSKQITDEINSPKLKYFKQSTVLSMTENYEFTVGKASGEYIICIGDDDGLVINSLTKLFDFIKLYNAKVIKCCGILYFWEGNIVTKDSCILYPLSKPVTQVLTKSVLNKVLNFDIDYYHLPMIYYGAIHYSVLQKIKDKQGSIFANAPAIDMYSGMCIAHLEDSFFVTDFPFTISGSSAKSNGSNHHQKGNDTNNISNEFIKLSKVSELYLKYNVPEIHHQIKTITWLCSKIFIDKFELDDNTYKINAGKCYLQLNGKNGFINNTNVDSSINQSFLKYNSDNNFININIDKLKPCPSYVSETNNEINYFSSHKYLDAKVFNIENVYDAAIFCQQIFISEIESSSLKIEQKEIKNYKLRMIRKLIGNLIADVKKLYN